MKKYLNIAALSDLHGQLPDPKEVDPVDVIVLCGDTVNLEYQRSNELSEDWFSHEFKDWVQALVCHRVIMIAGNHDFWMFRKDKQYIKNKFREWYGDKVIYLQDEMYIYQGVRFYGCPWCQGPLNWAFCPGEKYHSVPGVMQYYEQIPECDVLLTHQPPKIGNLGVSFYWDDLQKEDWSSDNLRLNIKDKNILVNFCGHIHSGQHTRIEYPVLGCETVFYNVSLLNERYSVAYDPMYVSIGKNERIVEEIKPHKSITKG